MKIHMIGNLIGVEKVGKSSQKKSGTLFAEVEVTHNIGIVRYVGPDVMGLKVGMKVYIGNIREEIRMADADIMVMKPDNIFAIVEDSNEETEIKDA